MDGSGNKITTQKEPGRDMETEIKTNRRRMCKKKGMVVYIHHGRWENSLVNAITQQMGHISGGHPRLPICIGPENKRLCMYI